MEFRKHVPEEQLIRNFREKWHASGVRIFLKVCDELVNCVRVASVEQVELQQSDKC